ncbi:hypothetical protein Ddc_16154 [Ditylenchus destructor]|nr:hypothetical protein Ddc_16154 [Ditylenchus destructor]
MPGANLVTEYLPIPLPNTQNEKEDEIFGMRKEKLKVGGNAWGVDTFGAEKALQSGRTNKFGKGQGSVRGSWM